jgi:hypothetical protein
MSGNKLPPRQLSPQAKTELDRIFEDCYWKLSRTEVIMKIEHWLNMHPNVSEKDYMEIFTDGFMSAKGEYGN